MSHNPTLCSSVLSLFVLFCNLVNSKLRQGLLLTFALLLSSSAAQAQNSAAFVSESHAATMTTGQVSTVSVTMRNTGTTTWTAGTSYRLGSQNPQDNTTWGVGRADLGTSVAPGQQYTFTFNVTAPATAGTYNFQWRMLREGVEWFGAASNNATVSVTVPPPLNAASFVSQSVSASALGGQVKTVSVTMLNTGNTTWTAASGYGLGSQNPENNMTWGLNRVAVGTSVAPGQQYTFTFNITAPAAAGTYNFQWRVLKEYVEWFGPYTPNVPITVTVPTNNAAFVAQSVPATVASNTAFNVTVTMQNNGSTTWTAGSYFLRAQNPDGTYRWGLNQINLPSNVAPGQQVTFSFQSLSPSTAGVYNYQWQMQQAGVGNFGAMSTNVAINVTAPAANASFVSQTVASTMTAGQQSSASVTMLNSGNVTWTAGLQFKLSAINPAGNATWGTSSVTVPSNVAPGSQVTFQIPVTAPAAAGTYNFQWQMYSGTAFGAATTNVPVTVSASAAPVMTLNAPVNGASATVGTALAMTATASGNVAAVTSVKFFANGVQVGTGSYAGGAWSSSWTPTVAGTFSVIASSFNASNTLLSSSAAASVTVANAGGGALPVPEAVVITPPHLANPDAGTLPGELTVSQSGSSNYGINLVLPPGTGAAVPALALSYSSKGGNGLMGLGWTLKGLSAIQRCSKTIAQDGAGDRITFTNADRLCLDGSRLVQVDGNNPGTDSTARDTAYWNPSAVYRTELDQFARISRIAGGGFKVELKNGLVQYFGTDAGSAGQAQGRSDGKPLQWMLARVEDRKGNYLTWEYNHNAATGEVTPRQIRYGGNSVANLAPDLAVRFSYEARPDTHNAFVGGSRSDIVTRLTEVRTFTGTDTAGNGGSLARNYQLHYKQSVASGRSLIDWVQASATNPSTQQFEMLPKTTFEWADTAAAPTPVKGEAFAWPHFDVSPFESQKVREPQQVLARMDDTGRQSMVSVHIKACGMYNEGNCVDPDFGIAHATGRIGVRSPEGVYSEVLVDFAPLRDPALGALQMGLARKTPSYLQFGDFNGDGRDDILAVDFSGSDWTTDRYVWGVCLNDGVGALHFSCIPGSNTDPIMAELRSDRKMHVVSFDGLGNPGTDCFYASESRKIECKPMAVTMETPLPNDLKKLNRQSFFKPRGANFGRTLTDFYALWQAEVPAADPNNYYRKTWYYDAALGYGVDKAIDVIHGVTTCFYSEKGLNCKTIDQIRSVGKLMRDISAPESLGDLNNDGLTDFMYIVRAPKPVVDASLPQSLDYQFGIQVPSTIRVCLSKETSVECTSQAKSFAPNADYSDPAATGQVDDFTGDGIARVLFDIVPNAPSLAGAKSELCRFTPDGFVCTDIPYVPVSTMDDVTKTMTIKNQRFQGGPAVLSDSGVSTHFVKHPSKIDGMQAWTPWRIEAPAEQDKLVRVINGLGHRSEAAYARGDNVDVYSRLAIIDGAPQKPVYPQVLGSAGIVVKQARRANGKGRMRVTDYRYEGAMSNAIGREAPGFGRFHAKNAESGLTTSGVFRRDFPYTGDTARSTTTSRSGVVISDTINRSNVQEILYPNGGKTYFTFLESSNTVRNDLAGIPVNVVNVVDEFSDGWGNLTVHNETVSGAGSTFTTRSVHTYLNTGPTWLLGLQDTVTLTKTDPVAGSTRRSMTYGYDAAGMLIRETIEPGTPLQVEVGHERQNNPFGVVQKSVQKWTDPFTGALRSRNIKDVDYDARGRFVLNTRNALGHLETRTYDQATGAQRSMTGPNQLTMNWTVDGFNRVRVSQRPDGTQTRQYVKQCAGDCPAGAVTATILEQFNGAKRSASPTVVYSDWAGHTLRLLEWGFEGRQKVTDNRYDDLDRLYESDHPRFLDEAAYMQVRNLYDDLNRVTEIQTLDEGGALQSARTAYSGLDRILTNALGKTTTETSDALGRLVRSRDRIGGITSIGYDGFGNVIRTTNPNGNVVTVVYDRLGRKTDMVDPDLGLMHFDVDPLGRVWKQTTPKQRAAGSFTRFEFDADNRTTGRYETDLESHWVFDTAAKGIGRLAEAYTQTGAVKDYRRLHTYDALGRDAKTTQYIGSGVYTQAMEYDNFGRLARETNQRGAGTVKMFDLRYNDKGYLSNIDRAGMSLWRALKVDAANRPTEVQLGNGMLQKSVFQPYTSRMDSNEVRVAGALRLSDSYKYDKLGNVNRRDQLWDAGGFSETFGYDDLSRLTSSAVTGQAAQVFVYDGAGNIKSKTGVGSGDYVYPPQGAGAVRPHAVQSIPGIGSFAYDANGNLSSGAGRVTDWNSFNMPIKITRGGAWSSFNYGPEHQRTLQSRSDGVSTVYAGTIETEQKGTELTVKTYWPNGIGLEIDKPDGSVDLRWVHKDRLGSPVAISDATGALKERLAYDVWGKRRTLDGSATPDALDGQVDNKGFTGHEMLDQLDLVHMNGRVFDPLVARFLSADPRVSHPDNGQSYNRYSYVLNNPLGYTDPTGFEDHPGETVVVTAPRPESGTVSLTGGGMGVIFVHMDSVGVQTGRGRNHADFKARQASMAAAVAAQNAADASAQQDQGDGQDGGEVGNFGGTGASASSGKTDSVQGGFMVRVFVIGEKQFRIVGGTRVQQDLAQKNYGIIFTETPRGRDMLKVLSARRSFFGNKPTEFVLYMNKPNRSDAPFGGDLMTIDPNLVQYIETTQGNIACTLIRLMAHELGHAVYDVHDLGTPQNMQNVRENENPIMRSLGMPARLSYIP